MTDRFSAPVIIRHRVIGQLFMAYQPEQYHLKCSSKTIATVCMKIGEIQKSLKRPDLRIFNTGNTVGVDDIIVRETLLIDARRDPIIAKLNDISLYTKYIFHVKIIVTLNDPAIRGIPICRIVHSVYKVEEAKESKK